MNYMLIKIVAHFLRSTKQFSSNLDRIIKAVDVFLSPPHMLATDNSVTHFKLPLQSDMRTKITPTAILV